MDKAFKRSRSNFIILGENHSSVKDIKFIERTILKEKPGMIILEHLYMDEVWSSKDAKERLTGKHKDLLAPGFNDHYYKLAVKLNIPFIGCDLDITNPKCKVPKTTWSKLSMAEKFKLREERMLEVMDKYYNERYKIVVIVGDTHLRTIKTDKLGKPSPINIAYKNKATIIRSKSPEIK